MLIKSIFIKSIFSVSPLVYTSSLTEDNPHLTRLHTAIDGTYFELVFYFLFCHFNPRECEWTTPRVKLRLLSSKKILTWLWIFSLLALITGKWFLMAKTYLYGALLVTCINFVAFREDVKKNN